ncbi:MAG TPA: hypothetical protein VIO11_00845, partial [Candidatus Methanoperedens sp.]
MDNNTNVRALAAYSLGIAFTELPDREKAFEDLHRLAQDKNINVRALAAYTLGAAFPGIPEKELAWEDLHRLAGDKNRDVLWGAAYSLGAAFPYITEKEKAREDLISLAQGGDRDLRVSANYSLGRASIFKAIHTENEEKFKKELETALFFFNKSSGEARYFNPALFCSLFYRTFYEITFNKQETETEIQEYLSKAKKSVEGSESKEKLYLAIEKLASALKEVKIARDKGLAATESALNAHRQYCEEAADLVRTVRGTARGAAKIFERGLPIICGRFKPY